MNHVHEHRPGPSLWAVSAVVFGSTIVGSLVFELVLKAF